MPSLLAGPMNSGPYDDLLSSGLLLDQWRERVNEARDLGLESRQRLARSLHLTIAAKQFQGERGVRGRRRARPGTAWPRW